MNRLPAKPSVQSSAPNPLIFTGVCSTLPIIRVSTGCTLLAFRTASLRVSESWLSMRDRVMTLMFWGSCSMGVEVLVEDFAVSARSPCTGPAVVCSMGTPEP
jgi:hypothetical protein